MAGENEISEEEIMDNDKDPMEAIREIRREEGVAEDDLPGHPTDEIGDVQDHRDRQEEADAEKDETGEAQPQASDDSEKPAGVETEGQDQETGEVDETAAPEGTETDGEKEDPAGEEDPEKEAGAKEDEGPVTRSFKANGQDFNFTQEEINETFETVFGQAMNYTQKMQKIAPYRKMISALESEGVTHDQLNLALDALKGDKGAIKSLLEQNKLDAYDLTSEDGETAPYVPKNYGKDESTLEIEEITGTIRNDEEFRITSDVIDNQWDAGSRQQIVSNPKMILGLHNDIKSGVYDKVAPVAMKMKVLDENSKSDIEYYMLAGQQLAQAIASEAKQKEGQDKVDELNADAQGAESEFDKATSEAARKRSANSTGARADRKGVIDYLDDDDEAYDAWYKKLQESV